MKEYLSIIAYLRKSGVYNTLNGYYRNIQSTHPSARTGEEAIDEVASSMLDAVKDGSLDKLQFLCRRAQEDAIGSCVGERLASLMLHVAAECGHADIVRYLVKELWVDVDTETVRGMTALHYATKANRVAVIRELAQLGADVGALNDNGQAPIQLSNDRVVRRLYQQYTGGGAAPLPYLRDRSAVTATRVVDYLAVMTLLLPPPTKTRKDAATRAGAAAAAAASVAEAAGDGGGSGVIVSELFSWPSGDLRDTSFPDPAALAALCTVGVQEPQPASKSGATGSSSGTLRAYGTILTDNSGCRSYAAVRELGRYRTSAQHGKAAAGNALSGSGGGRTNGGGGGGGGSARAAAAAAVEETSEFTVRLVVVLSQFADTPLHLAVAEQLAAAIAAEAESWGGLAEWPLNMEHRRMAAIRGMMAHFSVDLRLPRPLELVQHHWEGMTLTYGDAHAAHRHFPLLPDASLATLLGRLSPDNVLAVLTALLQEQSVLLLSEDVSDLGPVAEALCALLFPLSWPHTLVPTLPFSLLHYTEAPVPYLMGVLLQDLPFVKADLSAVMLVNLASNAVVAPLRPLATTSASAAGASGASNGDGGGGGSAQLEDLPEDLAARVTAAMERAIPAGMAPPTAASRSRRVGAGAAPLLPLKRPKPRELYAPAVRVAAVDMMVDLVGDYQTLRYVEGARARFIASSPPERQRFLAAMLNTQMWQLFREQCSGTGSADGRHSREGQVQLFTECVEHSRCGGRVALDEDGGVTEGASSGAMTDSSAANSSGSAAATYTLLSCGSVLYPSDDMEDVLESLAVLDLSADAAAAAADAPAGRASAGRSVRHLQGELGVSEASQAARGSSVGSVVDKLKERLAAVGPGAAQATLPREATPPRPAAQRASLDGNGGGGGGGGVFDRASSSWRAVREGFQQQRDSLAAAAAKTVQAAAEAVAGPWDDDDVAGPHSSRRSSFSSPPPRGPAREDSSSRRASEEASQPQPSGARRGGRDAAAASASAGERKAASPAPAAARSSPAHLHGDVQIHSREGLRSEALDKGQGDRVRTAAWYRQQARVAAEEERLYHGEGRERVSSSDGSSRSSGSDSPISRRGAEDIDLGE